MPDGTVLRARVPWPRDNVSASPAVCFRPLDVALSRDASPGQGGAGVVVQRLFLGDLIQITLRCNGYEIIACDRPRDDLSEGARMHWRVPPERCVMTWS
jgi:iron(III) transport system ATP-binding protein